MLVDDKEVLGRLDGELTAVELLEIKAAVDAKFNELFAYDTVKKETETVSVNTDHYKI